MIKGAFVSIGNGLLNDAILQRVHVSQRLNDHWTCEIECRDTLGTPIPGEDALGSACTIAHTAEDGTEHTAFSGIVYDVALTREVWGSYSCVLKAVSRSWLIDQTPRFAHFGTSSLTMVTSQIGAPAGASSLLPERSSPAEYVQFGESNWNFLLRLADDHGGWIRAGVNGTELRNEFDSPQPLIYRDHYGLLEFSIAGDVRAARVAASQYDSSVNKSQVWAGESKPPSLETAGQRMGTAVQDAARTLALTGFTPRSRSWTADEMQNRAQLEAERMQGTAVLASGTSRALSLLAGGSITLENLGEANGTWYLIEVTHMWDRTGYINHFQATPWSTWRAAERPEPPSATGVQPARVVSNIDPDQRGRLVVSLFWQEGSTLLLAPMISLHSGAGFGLTFMPEVGDEVLVGFLDADPERPVILGSLWNGIQQPPATGFHVPGETNGSEFAANNIKRLVTKSGNRIHLTDTPGMESISFATPRSNNFMLSEQVAETGRPGIAMRTTGDIHLRAAGRIHRQSATHSRHVDGKVMHDVSVRVTDWWGNTGAYEDATLHAQLTDGPAPQVPLGAGQHFSGIPQGANNFALPDFYDEPDIPEADA